MNIWYIVLLTLLLVHTALFAREIGKMGFQTWLRESAKQNALQHLASCLPKRLRIIGPLLYMLIILFCIYKIHSSNESVQANPRSPASSPQVLRTKVP